MDPAVDNSSPQGIVMNDMSESSDILGRAKPIGGERVFPGDAGQGRAGMHASEVQRNACPPGRRDPLRGGRGDVGVRVCVRSSSDLLGMARGANAAGRGNDRGSHQVASHLASTPLVVVLGTKETTRCGPPSLVLFVHIRLSDTHRRASQAQRHNPKSTRPVAGEHRFALSCHRNNEILLTREPLHRLLDPPLALTSDSHTNSPPH